jgi:hypothetical protein
MEAGGHAGGGSRPRGAGGPHGVGRRRCARSNLECFNREKGERKWKADRGVIAKFQCKKGGEVGELSCKIIVAFRYEINNEDLKCTPNAPVHRILCLPNGYPFASLLYLVSSLSIFEWPIRSGRKVMFR